MQNVKGSKHNIHIKYNKPHLAQVQRSQCLRSLDALVIRQPLAIRLEEALLPMSIPPQLMQISIYQRFQLVVVEVRFGYGMIG